LFFTRKYKLADGFSFLGVDMHNHVLPGLDDGAPDVKASLELLSGLKALGFERIVATPHTYMALYPNTQQTIEAAYNSLQEALGAHGDPSTGADNPSGLAQPGRYPQLIGYASEYMIDDDFRKLRTDAPPLQIGQKRVLIEMSFADEAPMLLDEVFQLQIHGYIPVLAHPERYPYLFGNMHYFSKLISLGCELQLNLLSLTDHYGKGPQKTALELLHRRFYKWAGTDVHQMGHIDMLHQLLRSTRLMNKILEYPFRNKDL
jgi:tyrosine-protein phosphatase YwqE